jgi:hypothetical protein
MLSAFFVCRQEIAAERVVRLEVAMPAFDYVLSQSAVRPSKVLSESSNVGWPALET